MILPAFTDNFRKFAKLALIIIIALSLRISKIEAAFPFDFDQQVPAATAYDFFVNHKITLIGQELSFPGFFIGPLYNWVQFIPYYFFYGNIFQGKTNIFLLGFFLPASLQSTSIRFLSFQPLRFPSLV